MSLLAEATAPAEPRDRMTGLPVVIIGAGPVGLAAAAHLLERGIEPLVLEQGDRAGAAILQWGHVRLFSPWRHVVDGASVRLLEAEGWVLPDPEAAPTGAEFVEGYLRPLAEAAALRPRIRYGVRVAAVSREGMDRTRTAGRESTPFVLRLQRVGRDGAVDAARAVEEVRARAVIDASGTYSNPNGIVASGLPLGDPGAVAAHLVGGLPDVVGRDRERFAGKRVVIVGSGHSAAATLSALGRLVEEEPGTRVTWLVRSGDPSRVFGSSDDELEGRAALGARAGELVRSGTVRLLDRFLVSDVVPAPAGRAAGVAVVGTRDGAAAIVDADVVVVATGFRPDLDPLREIRLGLDEVVEAPTRLAPLIDPNLHSCGTVPPHGVEELAHPEPGFFLAGMKSYGRAPTFLLLTGYEQVRSIAAELAGDSAAARSIELELPATGVCSTAAAPPHASAQPTRTLLAVEDVSAGASGCCRTDPQTGAEYCVTTGEVEPRCCS